MRPFIAIALIAVSSQWLTAKTLPLFGYQANLDRKGGFEIRKNVVYGVGAVKSGEATKELLADVFLPKGMRGFRKAAIVFVHGGGFEAGDKRDYHDDCRYFARKGFVAITINYRMRGDEPPIPPNERYLVAPYARAAVVDTKTALRWTHAQAESFGIDPDRIFLVGTSAGAIASLGAGVTGEQAFLNDFPGEPALPANSPGAPSYVRGIVDFCGGIFGMADSIDADDPPILIYHGIQDKTVPISMALEVRDRCLSVGLEYEFYPIEGGRHCPSQPAGNGKTLRELSFEFFLKRMDGRGEPVLRKASL